LTPKEQFEQTVRPDVEARARVGVKAVLEEVVEEEMTEHTSRLATGSLPPPGVASATGTTPVGQADRGLKGVKLMVSDDHEGIKTAAAGELPGVGWQRCVVHFERNVLSHVPASSMSEVAQDLKAVFKVRRKKTARALAEAFVELLYGKRFPRAVAVFEAGIDGALSYLSYPGSHDAKLRTTNMLERRRYLTMDALEAVGKPNPQRS
jgi:Transposase, Mutator family